MEDQMQKDLEEEYINAIEKCMLDEIDLTKDKAFRSAFLHGLHNFTNPDVPNIY